MEIDPLNRTIFVRSNVSKAAEAGIMVTFQRENRGIYLHLGMLALLARDRNTQGLRNPAGMVEASRYDDEIALLAEAPYLLPRTQKTSKSDKLTNPYGAMRGYWDQTEGFGIIRGCVIADSNQEPIKDGAFEKAFKTLLYSRGNSSRSG